MTDLLDDDCLTCSEGGIPEGECEESRRDCGHHCNHTWTHDSCCWCGWETSDDEPAADPAGEATAETAP